jgi:UDP-3-O-[3-hydroxymyristoyl] glucosamine N-acyltransferase
MIHPTAVIEPGAILGERVRVGANAYIAGCVTIGDDVWISPGAVIGDDGFGYDQQPDGSWQFKEHPFGVVIESDVHVGPNTIIDRGRRTVTLIRSGARIDTSCHVGHHCEIGHHTLLVAGVVLGGSTIIGDHCWIGLNATTREGVTIGDHSTVGMGAVVLEDVPAYQVWVGNPAVFLRDVERLPVGEPKPEPMSDEPVEEPA